MLSPYKETKTNKILQKNIIKNVATVYIFTTGKTTAGSFYHGGFTSICIYTSEGNLVVNLNRYTSCINNTD